MAGDLVRDFGFLTLGTRMKRIGDRLQADAQKIVESFGLPFQVAHYAYLAAIDRDGPLTIGELAVTLGVSQPGVTRTVGLLVKQGLLKVRTEKADQRRRVVVLALEGERILALSKSEIWPRIEAGVADLCEALEGPLLVQLTTMEIGLSEQPLKRRADRRVGVRK
jgi:DNA-binding MarR family transcriptional regulator